MTALYTYDVFSTLDGYGSYGAEGDWGGYWGKQGPEFLDRRLALYREPQRLVLGASTIWMFMQSIGPRTGFLKDVDPVNGALRNLPTTVVSTTLEEPLDWPDATLVRGDAVDVVARLKEESNVPLRSHGSLSMNRALPSRQSSPGLTYGSSGGSGTSSGSVSPAFGSLPPRSPRSASSPASSTVTSARSALSFSSSRPAIAPIGSRVARTSASSSGARSTYRTGTVGSPRRQRERDPGVAVDDEAGAPVDEDLLDPADRVERAGERVLLRLRVDPPVRGVGQQLVGRLLAGAGDPVAPGAVGAATRVVRHRAAADRSALHRRAGSVMDVRRNARSALASERTSDMAEMRKCIGSAKFGIEAHEAPANEFPAQPSQKDGLGRMCKTHWNQYTNALRKAALARKAAEGRRRAEPEPVAASRSRSAARARPKAITPAAGAQGDAG